MVNISIIITAYNYADYLGECIESCLHQVDASTSYEIIVIDDGSTDSTQLILNKINYKNLYKHRIENSGIEIASNFGFRRASGQYVVRVDADDKLSLNYLNSIEKYLTSGFDFYYPNYEVIDGNGEIIEEVYLPEFNPIEIRGRGDFLATGTIYSSKILRAYSYYSEVKKNGGLENYELILRLLKGGAKGMHINESLFFYRRHHLNISEIHSARIMRNGQELFRQLNLGLFMTNQYHPYIKIGNNE
jgi:glycosyltransferase involved in cell wall biosynthesis